MQLKFETSNVNGIKVTANGQFLCFLRVDGDRFWVASTYVATRRQASARIFDRTYATQQEAAEALLASKYRPGGYDMALEALELPSTDGQLVKRSSSKAEPTVVEVDVEAEAARVEAALARKVERAQESLRDQLGHGGLEQLGRASRHANAILEAQGTAARYTTVYPRGDGLELLATYSPEGSLDPIRGTVREIIAEMVERHAPVTSSEQADLLLVVPSRRQLAQEGGAGDFHARLQAVAERLTLEQAHAILEDVRARRDEEGRAWVKLWNKGATDCKATREQTIAHNRVGSALTYAFRVVFKRFPQLDLGRQEAKEALAQATEQLEGLRVEVAQIERVAEPKPEPRRLLVMACTATKRADSVKGSRMMALDRYDGPSFRVLRNFLDGRLPSEAGLAVWILSAEFGLIHWDEPIVDYDRRMDAFRAKQLEGGVRRDLKNIVEVRQPSEAFLMLGKDYLEAVGPLEGLGLPATTVPEGGIGYKLGALKRWLEQRTEGK